MATRTCTTGVEHVFDPDAHLCCKLRYWREGDGIQTSVPDSVINGPTRSEATAWARAAEAKGTQVAYAGPKSRWV